MTEAEARGALRTFVAAGEIERWIAAQPWQPMEKGWAVPGSLHDGWRFWVEPVRRCPCHRVHRRGGAGGLGGPDQVAVTGASYGGGSPRGRGTSRPPKRRCISLRARTRRTARRLAQRFCPVSRGHPRCAPAEVLRHDPATPARRGDVSDCPWHEPRSRPETRSGRTPPWPSCPSCRRGGRRRSYEQHRPGPRRSEAWNGAAGAPWVPRPFPPGSLAARASGALGLSASAMAP